MFTVRNLILLAGLVVFVTGCGDDSDNRRGDVSDADTGSDAEPDTADSDTDTDTDTDVSDTGSDIDDSDVDAPDADAAEEDVDDDGGEDVEDVDTDVDTDATEDVEVDTGERPEGLPDALAFEFTRPAVGEAPTESEIADFTTALTGLWRDTDYFRWVRMTSHGIDPSNEEGWFDYALWWQDTQAIRDGDSVIFRHFGRADNLTLRTCRVLTNAIAGYMMTGDEQMRWVVEQYSRGIAALAMVMEFGDDDPHRYLQARAPFTRNHEYETVGGRHTIIDYDPVRREESAWNAAIIHNPNNPHWGDVWFVNQRSKDDVPHMYRAVPMLMRAAVEAPDASVREAAELALEYLEGFARDVVDSGYQIRTKYEDGEPVLPVTETGMIKDLASLVTWESLVPNAECTAKLGSAYIGYDSRLENACDDGDGGSYEHIAATNHYFNYAIIRYFHIAAVHNALMRHQNRTALRLMEGLADRADALLYDESMPHRDDPVWNSDVAAFLVAAAAAGLPLTAEEARLVQTQFALSVEHYSAFEPWDPWSDSVEDGEFQYMPPRDSAVRPTEIAQIMEYCYSPLRNPATVEFVDCEVVADMSRWGE